MTPGWKRDDITGLILCGGRGRRMGGLDKGLQTYRGQPLVAQALQRLCDQVGSLLINANRNLDAYRALGLPVCSDTVPDHAGPLAGWLSGLDHCRTPYLVSVPCDTPHFPADLVERLAHGLVRAQADLAVAAISTDGLPRLQAVFCLMKTGLRGSLAAALAGGERRVTAATAS
jgi:molybdopterin-guanine dinucleotide biosynthesis protein A